MNPFARATFLANFVYQDDNARAHRARTVASFLEDQEVEHLPWPTCSPDMKPIEHGPLSKRRGSEKKAYLGEMKAWLGSIVDICTSMCAYNMYYSGKLS